MPAYLIILKLKAFFNLSNRQYSEIYIKFLRKICRENLDKFYNLGQHARAPGYDLIAQSVVFVIRSNLLLS